MRFFLMIYLVIAGAPSAFSQKWGGGVDDEQYHFGFTFQYVNSELKINKQVNWTEPFFDAQSGVYVTDPLNSIAARRSPGFGVGLVFNHRINNFSDFRITPTLVFNDRLVQYQYSLPAVNNTDFSFVEKSVETTMAEIPFSFKLKSERRNNFRAYLLMGAKLSLDIAAKSRTDDENRGQIFKYLKGKRSYLSYETGAGFDWYFHNFKISPEFKLGYSLGNVLQQDNSPFSLPIQKATLRQFTFSLFIE